MAILVCGSLYYAARASAVNAPESGERATVAAQRALLQEIEADRTAGRISEAESLAAKAELAREYMFLEKTAGNRSGPVAQRTRGLFAPLAAVAVAVLSLVTYINLGNPDLPAMPLASRPQLPGMSVADAVRQIEDRLAQTPDDLRGWQVLAPIYLQMGRFDDAAGAFRKVLELQPATAETETGLAEALILAAGGTAGLEALTLLESAAKRDPGHVRSRFYLAGESMRTGDFDRAIGLWDELLALSTGAESWLATARAGLDEAVARRDGTWVDVPAVEGEQRQVIENMVEGLAARLGTEGGSLDEWIRLVRSRLVLGQSDAARTAYAEAVAAYPEAAGREQLDALAAENGLR